MLRLCFRWFIPAVAAALAAPAWGGVTSGTLFQGRATESMVISVDPESGAAETRQRAVNYHHLNYLGARKHGLIARETIESQYLENTEGGFSTATVELYYGHKDKSYSPQPDHTTTVTDASEIHFNNDHWTATITGCCDAEPFLQMFAYGKSTPFLYANSRYAQVNLPNAQVDRYVGVVLRSQALEGPMDKAIFGDNPKAVAAIVYGGPGVAMQRLVLQGKPGVSEADLPYHTEKLALKSASAKDEDGYNQDRNVSQVLTLWSQDAVAPAKPPATLSGFRIVATFAGNDGEPEQVSVPIEKDRFGKAKLSGQTLMVAK